MNYKLEEIYSGRLLVGESPVWDAENNALFFVDIRGKCYYRMDYASGELTKIEVPQLIGCMALCRDGDLLLSMEDGIYDRALTLRHAPTKIKGERFNDGKIGPDGRYYVGTAGADFSGAFYRLDPDGTLTELFDGCGCSNGLDWTGDGKRMIYTDSRLQKVEIFDFDADSHSLSNRRTLMTLDESFGSPDGLALDENGDVWLAVWGGSCVLHIDGESGEVLDKIKIPARQVSSCCFAGDELRDLIITTAAVRTDPSDQPDAGKIYRIRTDVRGAKFHRFEVKLK